MKKIFYVLLIAFATSMTIASCTEEQVEPSSGNTLGGGGTSEGDTKP